MTGLDDVVEVIITGETAAVERAAFGRIAIVGEFDQTVFPQRYREVASSADVADLFPAYSAERKAVDAALSDTQFRPSVVLVRREPGTAEVHAFEVDRGQTAVDSVVSFHVDNVPIVDLKILAGDDSEDAADKIAAAINEVISHPYRAEVVEDGGVFVLLESQYGANEYEVDFQVVGDVEITADPGRSVSAVASSESIADVLTDAIAAGASFFGVSLVSDRPADILGLADFVAGEPYLAAVKVHDADGTGATLAGDTSSAAYDLWEGGYRNVLAYFHSHRWLFPELRNFGPTLAIDPDTNATTFALRSPQGLPAPVYALGATAAEAALDALNVNYFKRRGGILISWPGTVAEGEYADIVLSEFWLTARLQERVFGRIQGIVQGGGKLPYDDDGGTILEGEVRDMIADAIAAQHVTASIEPTFETPRRVDIPAQEVMTRRFPPIVATAYWAGAIHQARFRIVMLF